MSQCLLVTLTQVNVCSVKLSLTGQVQVLATAAEGATGARR